MVDSHRCKRAWSMFEDLASFHFHNSSAMVNLVTKATFGSYDAIHPSDIQVVRPELHVYLTSFRSSHLKST
jgi:hypothetical protein